METTTEPTGFAALGNWLLNALNSKSAEAAVTQAGKLLDNSPQAYGLPPPTTKQSGSLPTWVMPVGLGIGALLVLGLIISLFRSK